MIQKLYPGGKVRAFNISFDDGVEQDVRIVGLLNRYGLKGTFNLNYGLMLREFAWVHECGLTIRRLPLAAVKPLYRGHEVASHSFSHPYFDDSSEEEILKELASDKCLWEQLLREQVEGYATPFYYYSDLVEDCVRRCGFAYGRISEESGDFSIPENFHRWRGSIFHWDENLEDFVKSFLESDRELALCQLVGHSYDLDVMDGWGQMESILRRVSEQADVWPATHIEIVRYLNNMKAARISDGLVRNESQADLWFRLDGRTVCLHPGETGMYKEENL